MKKSILAISTAFALTACGGSSSSSNPTTPTTPVTPTTGFEFDATEMIENLTTNVIVQGYQDLNQQAELFQLASMNLVNDPSAENLTKAQQAWQAVRQPWEQGESHIFGPVDALSIDPHLDTWPLNTNDLAALLSSQSGFSAEQIKTWNDDVQGFHTMEYLLFGDGVADNLKSIDEMTSLEREYLAATSEVFKEYTQSLEDAWVIANDANDPTSKPYKDLLIGANNTFYSSQLGVVEELIQGLIGIVDEVGNGKISEPFGTSIDNTDTSLVESQYSWNSLADFTDNIKGVQNVYRGEFTDGADKQGLIDFVSAIDGDLAKRLDDEITTAINHIIAISGEQNMPFRQAINDEAARVRIQAAIEALTVVQNTLENDVVTELSNWTNAK